MSASEHRVQVRWADLDGLGHVNHPVVLTYLEEGRDAMLERCGIGREQYVVGRCTVTFRGEIDAATREVRVSCAVAELGRSSIRTSEAILSAAGETLVEAEFGIVLWDAAARGSRPITEDERAALVRSTEEVPQ